LVSHLSNLPAEVTSFVGRRQELREVKRLLTTTRLLTLTGSGGAGKTKLALRAGRSNVRRSRPLVTGDSVRYFLVPSRCPPVVRGDIKAFGNDPDMVPWLNAKHGFGGLQSGHDLQRSDEVERS
jgi:hypothetical protein